MAKKLITKTLMAVGCLAATIGCAAIGMNVATAKADETAVTLSGWGTWGGIHEGAWTETQNTDGSVTVTQSKAEAENRLPTPSMVYFDGLKLDVSFANNCGFMFGSNPYGCYATDSGLTFRLVADPDNQEYTRLLISRNGTETGAIFYDNVDDAFNKTNQGTYLNETAVKYVSLTSKTPTISLAITHYSTKRYELNITSTSLNSAMKGAENNSVSYYINSDDFTAMFESEATQSVKLLALGNAEGNASLTFKAVQRGFNSNVLEDPKPVDPAWTAFTTNQITPSENKQLVAFNDGEIVDTGNSRAVINENGSVTVPNEASGWGDRTGMVKNLPLDGLKITSFYTNMKKGDIFGTALGQNQWAFYGEGNLILDYTLYDTNQARLYVGNNHDVNNEGGAYVNYLYKTQDGAVAKNAENKIACIIFDGEPVNYSVEFTKMTEEVYKLTVQILNTDVANFHWANGFEDVTDTVSLYINISEIYGGSGDNAGNNLFNDQGFTMLAMATPLGNAGEVQMSYYVEVPASFVMNGSVSLEKDAYCYAGAPVEAVVTEVKNGDTVISADNYDVTYANNNAIGTATAIITFKNNYSGVIYKNFSIIGADASAAVVTLEYTSVVYTTMANEPAITSVKLGDTEISKDYYNVTYTNNVNAGTATVVITFKGDYSGTVTTSFEITKILKDKTGTDLTLEFADATYAAMTNLGDGYTYTVTDADNNVITATSTIAAGEYTVKAVKESATTIETTTYKVTVKAAPATDSTPTESTPADSQSDNASASEDAGCLASVASLSTVALTLLGVAAFVTTKRKERN